MMDLIHMTSMEKSLKNQYMDASNINARIHLHELYSTNKKDGSLGFLNNVILKTI